MFASQGGIQHLEAARFLLLLLACAAVIWWRVTLMIIAIAILALVGIGAAALLYSFHSVQG